MAGKHSRAKYFQNRRRDRVSKLLDFEANMPADFLNNIGRQAASNAINENRALNLPITIVRDGWVVMEMPDGTTKKLSQVHTIQQEQFRKMNLVKGAVIHVRRKN
ncbi:hypothetical protein [Chitinophaga sp. CB10]|uniref:hypothetical protein n=1 Tax=Chitinophaga sp. CB10 TaxID=1891659 RepID=UPI0025BC9976|nr:hypothetical protein [Chitinophaga sp. CB10]